VLVLAAAEVPTPPPGSDDVGGGPGGGGGPGIRQPLTLYQMALRRAGREVANPQPPAVRLPATPRFPALPQIAPPPPLHFPPPPVEPDVVVPASPGPTTPYPAGSLARLNTDTGRWSIYVPMSGALAGTPFGRALGQDDTDVEPPPPPNTVKKGDEPAQPPGTVNAGTEHKKRWYKKPLVIGGVVVGTLVLAGGAWLLLRGR